MDFKKLQNVFDSYTDVLKQHKDVDFYDSVPYLNQLLVEKGAGVKAEKFLAELLDKLTDRRVNWQISYENKLKPFLDILPKNWLLKLDTDMFWLKVPPKDWSKYLDSGRLKELKEKSSKTEDVRKRLAAAGIPVVNNRVQVAAIKDILAQEVVMAVTSAKLSKSNEVVFNLIKDEIVSRSLVSKFSVRFSKNEPNIKKLAQKRADRDREGRVKNDDVDYIFKALVEDIDSFIIRAKDYISLSKYDDDLKIEGQLGKYIDQGLIEVELTDAHGHKISSVFNLDDWTTVGEVLNVEDPVYRVKVVKVVRQS
jgi:hypothetical protein